MFCTNCHFEFTMQGGGSPWGTSLCCETTPRQQRTGLICFNGCCRFRTILRSHMCNTQCLYVSIYNVSLSLYIYIILCQFRLKWLRLPYCGACAFSFRSPSDLGGTMSDPCSCFIGELMNARATARVLQRSVENGIVLHTPCPFNCSEVEDSATDASPSATLRANDDRKLFFTEQLSMLEPVQDSSGDPMFDSLLARFQQDLACLVVSSLTAESHRQKFNTSDEASDSAGGIAPSAFVCDDTCGTGCSSRHEPYLTSRLTAPVDGSSRPSMHKICRTRRHFAPIAGTNVFLITPVAHWIPTGTTVDNLRCS